MARSHTVTRAAHLWRPAGVAVLVLMTLVCRPGAQGQNAAAPDALLASLLDRAATTAPGTYTMTGGSLEPARDLIALVVQADALRGERSIRIPVVLGAELSQPSVLGIRIVTVAAGNQPPRVVAEAAGSGPAGRLRFIREFTLAAGTYDVHAAVGLTGAGPGVLTAALVTSRLIVPDVWRDPLAVSPVVLGDAVAPASQAAVQPFTFGPTALSPAISLRYAQSGRLHAAFRVYNWAGQTGAKPDLKPDLTVEYVFYQQAARRLNFFNKMKPQHLRGDTLGGSFDPAAGVVTAGVSVPLGSFPAGEFQMSVRVTDNRNKQAVERQVRFVVAP